MQTEPITEAVEVTTSTPGVDMGALSTAVLNISIERTGPRMFHVATQDLAEASSSDAS